MVMPAINRSSCSALKLLKGKRPLDWTVARRSIRLGGSLA